MSALEIALRVSRRVLLTAFAVSLPAAAEIQVRDDLGRVITLPRPAERIVSLAPHLTELLFAAGAGDRIVAAVDYSDFPPAARAIRRIGDYTRFDLEAIVGIKPDLLVGWQSGNTPAQLAALERMGLRVFQSEPRRLEDIAATLERLGKLAGTEAQARAAAAAFQTRQARLAQRYRDRPSVSVFYQIWNAPLMTVNGRHLISDLLNLCGGENVFASLPALAAAVDLESILAADPEVIVSGGMGDERPQWLDDWRRWTLLTAVRRENLFFIPPDLLQRHTPRVLAGAERLCALLEEARTRRPR